MSWRHSFSGRTGSAALFALLTATPALAMDCEQPVETGERPRMEAFEESREFLAAMMSYRERVALQVQQRAECPELADDGTPETSPAHEDLEEAVARSRTLPPFDYARHPLWYNRTTSRTFELPPLPVSRMDDRLIRTRIIQQDDEILDPRLQSALLVMQGPMQDVMDGREAEDYQLRRLREHELEQKKSAADASNPPDFTEVVYYRNPAGTWLAFYYLGGELIHTAGFVAACLADQC